MYAIRSYYVKYSARLKPLLKRHVREILDAGVSVVMDFPGNTVRQRAWFVITSYSIHYTKLYERLVCTLFNKKRRKIKVPLQ